MGKKLKDTASEFEKLEAIKKLCDELTEENSMLLKQLDKLRKENRDCNEFIELNNKTYAYANGKLISELASIKSKWWYKLMTWKRTKSRRTKDWEFYNNSIL